MALFALRSVFYRRRSRLTLGAAAVICCALAGTEACAQRSGPAFGYAGIPQDVPEEAAAPELAPRLILPARPSPEAKLLRSYQRGSEAREDWPFTINLTDDIGCTGTLIGPNVLVTAAHCVERVARFQIMWAFDTSSGSAATRFIDVACMPHPLYRRRGPLSRLDYALCYLDEPFPEWVNVKDSKGEETTKYPVKFQRLSISDRDVRPRTSILLSGFGCYARSRKEIDGELRAGLSTAASVSPLVITLGRPFNRDSAVLCPGDSGGAAYRFGADGPYKSRVVVGINSASSRSRSVSYIARTSSPPFVRFLDAWRKRFKDAKICGLDDEIEHLCHP